MFDIDPWEYIAKEGFVNQVTGEVITDEEYYSVFEEKN